MAPSNPVRFVRNVLGAISESWNRVQLEDANGNPVDLDNGLPVSEAWQVTHLLNDTADDSDKVFTIPAGQEWQILWIWIELSTTVAVGNRQLVIYVEDGAGDIRSILAKASIAQAASLVYGYLFAPGEPDLLALRDGDYLSTPIPVTSFLQAGDRLRIWDNNAVAAAADDMVVHIRYAYRSI